VLPLDIDRLARVYPRDVLWPMMEVSSLSTEALAVEASVQAFAVT